MLPTDWKILFMENNPTMRPSFWPWWLVLIFGLSWAILILMLGNTELFEFINRQVTPLAGQPARIFSLLGESAAMGCLLVAAWRIQPTDAFRVAAAWLLGACFSWTFKLFLLKGLPRPFEHYKRLGITVNMVDGVTVHHLNSFPSGHTLTAFSAAFLIRILFPDRPLWHALAFLLAILCGLSRVVLVQHWPADVLGGMILGLLASFLVSGRAGWPPAFLSRLFPPRRDPD